MRLPFFGSRKGPPTGGHGLRNLALTSTAASLGLAPTAWMPKVWGLMMEEGISGSFYSLVVFGEGSTSLYFGRGGGIVGAGDHQPVRRAAEMWLATAQSLCDDVPFGSPHELPAEGELRFTLRTFDGERSHIYRARDVREASHPLVRLYAGGQSVMTEIRKLSPP